MPLEKQEHIKNFLFNPDRSLAVQTIHKCLHVIR